MLRWMCGVTNKDKIRNEHVRGSVTVAPVEDHREKAKVVWILEGGRTGQDNVDELY